MLAKKIRYCFCLVALSVPVAASAQSTLSVGQRVKTTANVNVRSKPTNAKKNALCIQTTGSVGTIVGGPTVATGYTWWNVNFDSKCDGWAVHARPCGTKGTFSGGALTIKTSIMKPNTSYALYWSNSASGPWTLLQNNISVSKEQYKTITDSSGCLQGAAITRSY